MNNAHAQTKKLNIAVLLYDGLSVSDFTGPVDVFVKANRLTNEYYNVYTFSMNRAFAHGQENRLVYQPDYTVETMPKPDVLLIPGGTEGRMVTLSKDEAFIQMVKSTAAKAKVLMPVCTGAFIAAAAGLLNGRRTTTHYLVADSLQKEYPAVHVVRNVRYVVDDNLISASGVTCGYDAALYLVQRYSGGPKAAQTANMMQYKPQEKERWPAGKRK